MTDPAPFLRFAPAHPEDVSPPFELPGGLLVVDASYTASGPRPRLSVRLRNVDGSSDTDAAETGPRHAEPGAPLAARHALAVLGGMDVLTVQAADCAAVLVTVRAA